MRDEGYPFDSLPKDLSSDHLISSLLLTLPSSPSVRVAILIQVLVDRFASFVMRSMLFCRVCL